jgi:ribosomal protein S18 acetylase RimI-like enzyme
MFAPISEDFHESSSKRKPRLPKSRGVLLNSNVDDGHTLDLSAIRSTTPRSSISSSSSSLGLNLSDNLVISGDLDPVMDSLRLSLFNTLTTDASASAVASFSNSTNATAAYGYTSMIPRSIPGSSTPTTTTTAPLSRSVGIVSYMTSRTVIASPVSRSVVTTPPKTRSSSATSDAASFSIPNSLNISIEMATIKDYRRVAKTLVLAFEEDPFMNYILNTSHIKKTNTTKSIYKKKKLDLMLAYFEYSVYECLNLNGKVFVIKDNASEAILEDMGIKTHKFPFLGVSLWNQIYGNNIDTGYSSTSSDSDDDLNNDEYFAPDSLKFKDNIHPSYLKFNVKTILGNCRSKILKDKLPFLTKVRNEVLVKKLIKREQPRSDFDIWYLSDIATLPSMRGKGLGKILINHVIDNYIMVSSPKSYVYLESSNPVNRKFYTKLGFKLMKSFSIKSNKYVDSETIAQKDPSNEQINMDSMVYYPSDDSE